VRDEIVFRFPDEGIAASARLLEEAPETGRVVVEALPVSGLARHGIYSGSEIYLVLPDVLTPPQENATTAVQPGDVGFLTLAGGASYGFDEDYSEICWFYDRDARPSMAEGPIAVSLFARFADADTFFAACRRMRVEGAKRIELSRGK
jgi:hypothetical protein